MLTLVWLLIPAHSYSAENLRKRANGLASLNEPEYDSVILRGLDLMFQMNYSAADSLLRTLPEIPARSYFLGLLRVNRYNDLGDTSALSQAESLWRKLDRSPDLKQMKQKGNQKENVELYRGLTGLQLSYVAGIRGRRLEALTLGRKAVAKLRAFPEKSEAQAAIALYDYYKASMLKGIKWVPFVKADQSTPLDNLEAAIPQSRYLHEVLQTSLLWLYYDRGQYEKGLALIAAFLDHYPQNRLYRQIKADFYYRKGDISLALQLQLSLNKEYKMLNKSLTRPGYLPIGYLSSVGNLAKIYANQKEKELLRTQLTMWNGKDFRDIMAWLPSSLKDEVKSIKN